MGNKAGRPRVIDPEQVAALRRAPERFTWKEIAVKLGVSESSVIRVFRPFRRLRPLRNKDRAS